MNFAKFLKIIFLQNICGGCFWITINTSFASSTLFFSSTSILLGIVMISACKVLLMFYSHWKCSLKKAVLYTFAKFTGKHLCQSTIFNKVTGRLRPATLLNKRSYTGVFLSILGKIKEHVFYRTPSDDCFIFVALTCNSEE